MVKTKTTDGDLTQEVKELREQNAALSQEVERLKDEIIRLVSRNLDITERLEEDTELRRRVQVAREIFEGNLERQRNADLLDDGQLMALLEIRIEEDRLYCQPDFDVAALAEKIGVSPTHLSNYLRGAERISRKVAERIVELWPEVRLAFLLSGDGPLTEAPRAVSSGPSLADEVTSLREQLERKSRENDRLLGIIEKLTEKRA